MDRPRIYDEDRLRHDAESILGQAITLACLVNVKAEEQKKSEDKRAQQIVELQRDNDRLLDEIMEVNRLCLELA